MAYPPGGALALPYPLQLDLSIAGLALVRNWLVGDRETVDPILDELERLAAQPRGEWVDVPLRPTAEGYTAWAETYDQAPNPMLHLEGPVMAELFARLESGRALDAACGTGRHAAVLDSFGHEVIGVDENPAMLARARERLPEGDFRPGQLDALPLEDGSVDLAVCSLALTHLADPTPAIVEFARVVRPGGRIVLSDVHPSWIALGAQAAFRDADERRGYVQNHIHWVSTYLRAFSVAGLAVLDCRELPYGRAEADLWIDRQNIDVEVAYEALVGMPAVLLWELARP